MNTDHTPGPWTHDKSEGSDWGWIRDKRGVMVAVCSIPEGEDLLRHRRNKTDPTECNARLIAAAPDLLEALKGMLFASEELAKVIKPLSSDPIIVSARAAISKAEGKA